ncbi:MAG: sialidase family protein [bacterium]|nr:sialidase family protein [bacterium]
MKRIVLAVCLIGWATTSVAGWVCECVGEPVPLCQGPTWEKAGWGPYQFPRAFVLEDGHVVCSVHVSRDAITNYADPYRWFETRDGGETWREVAPEVADRCGVCLANGDVVSFPLENSSVLTGYTFTGFEKRLPDGKWRAPAEGKRFPVPDGARGDLFGSVAYAYLAERLPEEFRSASWLVRRLRAGASRAEDERAAVDWPMLTRVVHAHNGFSNPVLKAICPKGDAKLGPDGAIWVSCFSGEGHIDPETRQYSPYYAAELFRSEDGGRTFTRRSHMGYPADGRAYPYASGGFSDNDFEFLPDGSMIWFMRSNWYGTTGEEQSPMYVTRSTDMGRTWTMPERFSDLGTFPRVIRLKNGALAVMYGRPGLFVRVSEDGCGRQWSEPLELLTAGDRSSLANRPKANPSFHDWDGECGNGAFVPVSEDTALAIYGDFYWPDAQGVKRKTILARKIRIRPVVGTVTPSR